MTQQDAGLADRVTGALAAFGRGGMVIVTDDDGRENEGDLVASAALCTPEAMAFMIRHTCGIVCAPLTRQAARRLHLAPMVADNEAPHATAFTVSVDARAGTTTGISAADRTATLRALADGAGVAADFVRPGHVFPLVAREGGVLERPGHTEAAVDLCRMTDLPPVGVICELVNDDGTVMRRPQLLDFARAHGLPLLSVADLIAWRRRTEPQVARTERFALDTAAGPAMAHAYRAPGDPLDHYALVFGEIGDGTGLPVHLHREDIAADVLGSGGRMQEAMQMMQRHPRGILIYQREAPHSPRPPDAERHPEVLHRDRLWQRAGIAAHILRDLGVRSVWLPAQDAALRDGIAQAGIAVLPQPPLKRTA